MSDLTSIIHQKKLSDKRFEKTKNVTKGILVNVDFADNPSVAGRAGYVWVRENYQNGGIFQCFNPTVKNVGGLPVLVKRGSLKSSLRIIEGIDWSTLSSVISTVEGQALQIPNHHRDHEWPDTSPGLDVVNVYVRALVPLRIFPGSLDLTLSVASGHYLYNGNVVLYPGMTNDDISGYIPTTVGNYVILMVSLDPVTNDIIYTLGVEAPNSSPVKPTVLTDKLTLGYILLYEGMTTLTEADIIEDTRPVFTINSSFANSNKAAAWVEAEFDYALTRHVVSGG